MRWFKVCSVLGFVLALCTTVMLGQKAHAADFPKRNITITVPSSAGGGSDLLARTFATHFEKYIKTTVVTLNKGGGGGTIASSAVAHARPDGYNMLLTVLGGVLLQPLYGGTDYTGEDLRPICTLVSLPVVLVANKQSGITNLQQFVDAAKANVGNIKFSVADAKSLIHLSLEDFAKRAGITLKAMPQMGANPAVAACLGNHVQSFVGHPSEVITHVQNGDFIPLAVFSDERLAELPDTPTFKELGYDVRLTVWKGIAVPAKTPDAIVKILEDAAQKTADDPAYKADLLKLNENGQFQGAKASQEMWAKDSKTCETILKSLGLYMMNK